MAQTLSKEEVLRKHLNQFQFNLYNTADVKLIEAICKAMDEWSSPQVSEVAQPEDSQTTWERQWAAMNRPIGPSGYLPIREAEPAQGSDNELDYWRDRAVADETFFESRLSQLQQTIEKEKAAYERLMYGFKEQMKRVASWENQWKSAQATIAAQEEAIAELKKCLDESIANTDQAIKNTKAYESIIDGSVSGQTVIEPDLKKIVENIDLCRVKYPEAEGDLYWIQMQIFKLMDKVTLPFTEQQNKGGEK